jgi:menaquinol-cytochrome c reductase iron-sulfur subunit
MSQPRETHPASALDGGEDGKVLTRRRLLARLTLLSGTLLGALAGLPVVGFLFQPLLVTPSVKWRPVGRLDEFRIGTTTKVELEDPSPLPWSGVTGRTAAWLRRLDEESFEAFSVNCRHLGCPVRWLEGAELFMCPCHGGVYYKDGSVAAGPPPEPLAQYPVRVRGSRVEVATEPIPLTTFERSV